LEEPTHRRLVDPNCPARRSRIVMGGQVGGAIGRTRRPRKLQRLAAVGMPAPLVCGEVRDVVERQIGY
jgi:hypothetical protein